uniref:LSDAT_euk domain-containing protein n=1 Tax=Macrostomum lignano TaxID=282301 RepID=A0A1I8GV60_9PLAT
MDGENIDLSGYRQHIRVQPVGPDYVDQPGPDRLEKDRTTEEDGSVANKDRKRERKHKHRKHRHRSRRSRDFEEESGAGADASEADTVRLSAAAADNAAFSGGAAAKEAGAASSDGRQYESQHQPSPRRQQHPQNQQFGATVAPVKEPSSQLTSRSNRGEPQLQQTQQTLHDFAKQNINMRLCKQYIPNPADEEICHCNRPPQWHREQGIPVQQSEQLAKVKWRTETCARVLPTNAFGRMKLQGFGRLGVTHKPFYIRIDSETRDFEALWELMTSPMYWALPLPDLVLSVNGGAKKMEKMSAKLLKKVKQGLTNVASGVKTTWILTPGFNLGCSQLVGQAIQEYNFAGGAQQIWVIGLCSWGAVYNRECLEIDSTNSKAERIDTVEYANCTENPGRGQAAIEPNHTHFIFCDNGTVRYFGTEMEFRADFEQYIVNKLKTLVKNKENAFNPPVVQLVIEGGKKAVLMAGKSAEAGTPVITVQGSGRAANELAFFRNIRNLHSRADDEFVLKKIKDMLNRYQPTWKCNELEAEEITRVLMQFSKEDPKSKFDCHMLSVYNTELDEDMAKTILYTFFKHKDYKDSTMTQVRLCMAWQRADIAAAEIFAEARKSKWTGMNLQRAMKEALNKQQVDFVKLFLEHGIDLSKFLSLETLSDLYAKMFRSGSQQADRLLHKLDKLPCCSFRSVSSQQVWDASNNFNKETDPQLIMQAVNWLIKVYTEHAVDNLYTPENLQENPMKGASPLARPLLREAIFPPYTKNGKRRFTSQDLFLWSLLTHNVELAVLFWKHGKDQIGSALIGYSILNNMAMDAAKRGEMETTDQLTRDAHRFEQLAVGVLEECSKNRAVCRLLLIRSLPYWNQQTVMAIAEANQCMDMLYQTPVQTVLTQTWMGGMEADTSNWRIILCLFLPFLVPVLVFHQHAADQIKDEPEISTGDQPETQRQVKSVMKEVEAVDMRGFHAREAMEDLQVEEVISDFNKQNRREMRLRKMRHQRHGFRRMAFCTSLGLFYSAPICKFILNKVGELSYWDKFDMVISALFVLCLVLRLTVACQNFDWVRNAYALTLALCFIRFMQFYYPSQTLGPKVVMIINMLNDVIFFVLISALAYFSLMTDNNYNYVNKKFDFHDIMRGVLYIPYWQMYGELELESVDQGMAVGGSRNWLVIVLMAFYMLGTNVLLLNLLIAMF